MPTQDHTNAQFIIIYDTYCGWCYGAAPLFDSLVNSGANVEVLHRHLFQYQNALPLASGKGELIMQADARIAELSGQQFSQLYIDNVVMSSVEVLDSGYTAQAAALVHHSGARKEFALRKRLEEARYIGGISASDAEVVVEALMAEGVSKSDAARIGSPALQKRAAEISGRAQKLMMNVQARGIPTILRRDGEVLTALDHAPYYGSPENFIRQAMETIV